MHNKSSMKTIKTLSMFGSAVILPLLCGTSALAATLLVDEDKVECPDAGFSQIQNAVNQAAPGDIIEVCPGIYDEQVKIAKPLSLVGVGREGKKAAVIQPSNMTANTDFFGDPVAAAVLVKGTFDVTIKNMTVDGVNNGVVCEPAPPFLSGIFFRNASGEIESVAVRNIRSPKGCALGDAIDVQGSEQAISRLTVRDSSLHDYDGAGILAIGPGVNLHALRNVITGLGPSRIGQAGIQLYLGGSGSIEDNIITNNVFPCTEPLECDFPSHNIAVLATKNVTIARNIVGKSNVGIFAGGRNGVESNGLSVLENTVFDTDAVDGVFVAGNNNVVKDNSIINSARAGVSVFGMGNTIQNNTINEAAVAWRVTTGNDISNNRLFNIPVKQELLELAASAASSQDSLEPAVTASSLLRKGLRR